VTVEITPSIQQVLDHLVDRIPGVVGALVSSADGFTLAARTPSDPFIEPAGLGAMSAAGLALSNRLVTTMGESAATVTVHRSADGQVVVLPIAHLAVLTILASPGSDAEQLALVGREATRGLDRLFRGAASV